MKPGQIIKTFTAKSGKEVVLRYPTMDDVDILLVFINTLSKEDTFINFSGEQVTREEEEKFVRDMLERMEKRDKVMLLAFIDNELVGNCGIERITANRRRKRHVGVLGITIKKEYRDDGIGRMLLETIAEQAREKMQLKILTLEMFAPNRHAHALYKKVGFQEYGRLPDGIEYKNTYVDGVLMYKKL